MEADKAIDEKDFTAPLKAGSEEASQSSSLSVKEQKLVGQVLDSQFQVLEVIGQGGMSVVYKAIHLMLNKEVAIKTLHTHLTSDQKALLRFKQEAQAAIQLDHPNIIKEYGFGVTEGEPYIVLDYLEGVSLSEFIKKNGALSVQDALNVFIQCCSALEHAHSKGVIHRDIKPSNIMLVEREKDPFFVKIVDFGIAKVIAMEGAEAHQLTQTGEIFGSPSYMSPEQCVGKQVDNRSDIYALACVLYEALRSVPPFQGNNVYELIHKHINDMPAPLSMAGAEPALVERLDGIIFRALAKEPAQRYQSMRELEQDLRSVKADLEFGKSGSNLIIKIASWQRSIQRYLKAIPKMQLLAFILLPVLGISGLLLWSQFSWFFEAHKFGIFTVSWIDELERRPKLNLSPEERQQRLDAGEILSQFKPLLWGENSTMLLHLWQTRAEKCRQMGENSKELEAREKVLEMMTALGYTHNLDYANACEDMVRCRMSRGNMSQSDSQSAEKYMLKALDIRSKVSGMRSVKTYMRLAELLLRTQQYSRAKEFYKEAIAYCKQYEIWQGSVDYAACLAGLADVYRLEADAGTIAKERQEFYKHADLQYASARQCLSESNSPLARRFSNQICLYRAYVNQMLGKYADARHFYEEALPYAQKLLSARPHEYKQLLDDYAYTAFCSGDPLKALELRKEQRY